MSKAYPTITLAEVSGLAPVTADLVGRMWERQESLISQPIDCRFDEITHNTSTATVKAQPRIYIPYAAATAGGGQVLFRVVFEMCMSGGAAGQAKMRLYWGSTGGTMVTCTCAASVLAYVRKEIVIPVADVTTCAGAEVILEVSVGLTAGTGTVYARNIWGGCSRLERA